MGNTDAGYRCNSLSCRGSGRTSLLGMSTASSPTDAPEATAESDAPQKQNVRAERVLSGVQPTGSLHLGNYLGAIRQWVDFQNNEQKDDEGNVIPVEKFFCVVDLHAITMPHDPKELRESTLSSAALYIAAGIDPAKSNIFVQSHVPAHSELTWLLNCITPLNWLERMIQFKEKAKKQGESVGVGLLTYPCLMAADIILYQATKVPVGEDQRQHLELTRDIVRRFNDMFCKGNPYKKRCREAGIPSRPVFIEPDAIIMKEGARVMSLTDGTNKMSKSDANDASRINVLDPPQTIRDKIKRCKTDSLEGIEWDNPERPEATNLLNIYLAVQPGRTKEDILEEVSEMSWGQFKPLLAEAVVNHLQPIQERYYEVRNDEEKLNRILKDGADAANAVAQQTLFASKIAMGFVTPTK
ncbi:tryptophanyl-tRNA synthetase [Nitzschia inconspicua]|uniref:tryptophan--tRNA ligase n=1 Tax=Nitzschia inconspicua TaxID=303405 RepID=A0A9K3L545_9STRA|nr:tryptophanyl-tRNA synthetase [Nitzschia inconspicua]